MTRGETDSVTMLGLHRLAANRGDGLVPELYALLSARARMLDDNPEVIDLVCHRPGRRETDNREVTRGGKAVILRFPAGNRR